MNIHKKFIFYSLIFLSMISPPVIFAEAIYYGREIRSFLAIILIFFMFLTRSKFEIAQLIIFLSLGFILIIEILVQRSDINNIFSFYAILLISFFLFKNFKNNELKFHTFLNVWLKFSLILSFFAVISYVIHQFTFFNFDLFDFKSSEAFKRNYPYQMSIFGNTIDKAFGSITVSRVCSFFNEPLNAGIFFGLNLLLTKINRNFISKKYAFFFLVAGLLTFSVTFYMILLFLILGEFKLKLNFTNFLGLILIFSILILMIIISDVEILENFISYTSFDNRIERETFALKSILESPLSKFLFGHGTGNYAKAFPNNVGYTSTGYVSFLFEFGIITFVAVLIFVLFFLKSRFDLLIVLSIVLLTYPIYRSFIYWYVIILIYFSYINIQDYPKYIAKLKK